MNLKDPNRLRELQEAVTLEYNISADTLRRLLAKVEEYSESHRAFGLPEDLLAILQNEQSSPGSSRREEALIPIPNSQPNEGEEALIQIRNPQSEIRNRQRVFIDSITLENFGPYYGEHTFNFATLEDRCGILIGGKTGAGKTHLLRALYLAVVGEAGVIDLKKVEPGSEATRFLFEKSLNRRAQAEGRDTIRFQVGISQRDDLGGATRKAILVREIRHRPNAAPVWYSYADRFDGSLRVEDPQHLEKLRDALLPRHLARFFFFDAERGLNFNFGQQEIVEGATRILGLWSYAELARTVLHLIQRNIPRIFNTFEAPEATRKLAELSGRIVTAEGQLTALRDELTRVSAEIDETKTELAQVEERLANLGAIDPAELQRVQDQRASLAETKARLQAELAAAWEISIPIALLGPFRRELHDKLLREEKRRDWESSKAALEPKISQVQHEVFGDVPDEYHLPESTLAFYSQRLEAAHHRLIQPPPEGMAERVFLTDSNEKSAQIRRLLADPAHSLRGLPELSAQIGKLDAELREMDSRLQHLTQDAAALDLGAELHGQRGELASRCEQLAAQQADLERRIHSLEDDLKQLKREETNQTAVANKASQGQNLIAVAGRYREVAGEIRARAADELRGEISEQVGELWVEITERQREFLGMDFDQDWNCSLLRRDGKRASWEDTNTSAGQRQVRTLAFFEALRRLARIVPPLVVDTPLGRLDKEVKDSVLDRLYLTGHQTIILTTNSEIDPALFERIQHKLARVYTLHPHGEPDSPTYEVRVTTDYFGKTL